MVSEQNRVAAGPSQGTTKSTLTFSPDPVLQDQPVATAPAFTALSPAEQTDYTAEITDRLYRWAAAWTEGDVVQYLSYYLPNTSPISGRSYNSWVRERRQRIFPNRNIRVDVSNVEITQLDDNTVITQFNQRYSAKDYNDFSRKQLVWVNRGGNWFINKEVSVD